MITIRRGTHQDTETFIKLMALVRQNMDHKEWLFLDPPDEVRRMMADGTMSLWVAVDGECVTAAFDFLFPQLGANNYGYSIGLTNEELMQVVNMDTAVVHPDFRGLGLQKRVMRCAEEALVKLGKHILMCTVHPDNGFSLNNALSQGYTICGTMPMYGSIRHMLRKNWIARIFCLTNVGTCVSICKSLRHGKQIWASGGIGRLARFRF